MDEFTRSKNRASLFGRANIGQHFGSGSEVQTLPNIVAMLDAVHAFNGL